MNKERETYINIGWFILAFANLMLAVGLDNYFAAGGWLACCLALAGWEARKNKK